MKKASLKKKYQNWFNNIFFLYVSEQEYSLNKEILRTNRAKIRFLLSKQPGITVSEYNHDISDLQLIDYFIKDISKIS
jgi:hypothetical protein